MSQPERSEEVNQNHMPPTNPLEPLALSGAETLCFTPGTVADYDVELYQRIPRKLTAWGEHVFRDVAPPETGDVIQVPGGCRGPRPYLLRLGGFRRERLFATDEIASALVQAGIRYVDGIGNGLFETLLLCRKHGLWPTFEAPALGFELPFAREDFPAFRELYRRKLQAMREHLRVIEHILGRPIVGRPNQPWVLWLRYSPLALYDYALRRNAEGIRREMRAEIGMEVAPSLGDSAAQQADLARFWTYIRRRHAELLLEMARLFREEIVGEGLIIGNMHANPVVDYSTIGVAFDHPGVAVRPTYLEDLTITESYVAFAVQLFRDLTGKAPIVSIRTNLLSAGSRYIPGPHLVERWYNAALRGGAAGFYLWPRDYPSSDDGSGYDGPMPGNPDPSTRGRERWDDHLRIFARLSSCRVFIPPEAQVGLLVSWKTFDTGQWLQAFHAFVHLDKARIRCRFQEAEHAETGKQSLSRYKLLVVPVLTHCSEALLARLAAYLDAGGVILAGHQELAGHDEFGQPRQMAFSPQRLSVPVNLMGHVWYEPMLVEPASAGDSAALEARLDALCTVLGVQRHAWVYQLGVGNLAGSLGRLEGFDVPAPSPGLALEHYLYEHSSDWILPEYQQRAEESFRQVS